MGPSNILVNGIYKVADFAAGLDVRYWLGRIVAPARDNPLVFGAFSAIFIYHAVTTIKDWYKEPVQVKVNRPDHEEKLCAPLQYESLEKFHYNKTIDQEIEKQYQILDKLEIDTTMSSDEQIEMMKATKKTIGFLESHKMPKLQNS